MNLEYNAINYAKLGIDGTGFLVYREFPELVKKYHQDKKITALDFGCGTGRSTRFFKKLCADITGFDNQKEMIKKAKEIDSSGNYTLFAKSLPVEEHSVDLVFATLVFFDVQQKEDILHCFKDIARVLKRDGGTFMLSHPSNDFYSHNWLSVTTQSSDNSPPVSGCQRSVVLQSPDGFSIEAEDTVWFESDFEDVIADSGLRLLEKRKPFGCQSDNISWGLEKTIAPYVYYVLSH